IGTTSYLAASSAWRMEAAELSETSCSPERPPKRMPTLSFFLFVIPEVTSDRLSLQVSADLLSGSYLSALRRRQARIAQDLFCKSAASWIPGGYKAQPLLVTFHLSLLSQYLLPQGGSEQAYAQDRCLVHDVDDWINFHDFNGNHPLAVGDHLHSQMRFPEGNAARDGRAYTRRVLRVHDVHIKGDGKPRGLLPRQIHGFFDDGAHALFVDVTHREGVHPRLLHQPALTLVDVP